MTNRERWFWRIVTGPFVVAFYAVALTLVGPFLLVALAWERAWEAWNE